MAPQDCYYFPCVTTRGGWQARWAVAVVMGRPRFNPQLAAPAGKPISGVAAPPRHPQNGHVGGGLTTGHVTRQLFRLVSFRMVVIPKYWGAWHLQAVAMMALLYSMSKMGLFTAAGGRAPRGEGLGYWRRGRCGG